MSYNNISAGSKIPQEINVVIEIAKEFGPIKYEFDEGVLKVDRIMSTTMQYPCNYGFVPNTLSGDGDPLDVLVHTNHPILPGAVIAVRPVGVLITEDEGGSDAKILALPTKKIDPYFAEVDTYEQLPTILLERIRHFFEHYKDLEKGKWVKVTGWQGVEEACKLIEDGVKRYQAK
jgi:inorganic pyrophosphatase